MTISLRTMLKNVASENYDKTNIFLYILIVFLTGVLSGIFVKPTDNPYQMMMSFLVFLIPFLTPVKLLSTHQVSNDTCSDSFILFFFNTVKSIIFLYVMPKK